LKSVAGFAWIIGSDARVTTAKTHVVHRRAMRIDLDIAKKVARRGTLGKGGSVTLDAMEQQAQEIERREDQPGYGVDRAQIRALLALTPAERLRVAVAASQNLAKFLSKIRRVR